MLRYFFESLFNQTEGYIELRGLGPLWSGSPRTNIGTWHQTVDDALTQVEFLKQLDTPIDIYFGVCRRPSAQAGTNDSTSHAQCVWVDVDAKDIKGGKDEAYRILWSANGVYDRPTFLVDSGHGYHGYWVLDGPSDNLERITQINRGLTQRYQGDVKSVNAARILRVPNTLNVKVQDDYAYCSLVHYSGHFFDTGLFKATISNSNVSDFPINPYRGSSRNWREYLFSLDSISEYADIDTLPLDSKWKDLILYGNTADSEGRYRKPSGEPDRSTLNFAACKRLVSYGLSNEAIASIFLNPSYRISDKVLEFTDRRAQRNYLCLTIGRARESVENDPGH